MTGTRDSGTLTWVEQTMTLDAIDPAVRAIDDNLGWRLLHVGCGSGGQTTLTYGWPWPGHSEIYVRVLALRDRLNEKAAGWVVLLVDDNDGPPCANYTARVWSPTSPVPEDDHCVNCGHTKAVHNDGDR